MFRGREIAYVDQGYKMMRQLAEMVKDIAIIEATPKLEGKKLIMILAPSGKRPVTSGAAKGAGKPKVESSAGQKASVPAGTPAPAGTPTPTDRA